MKNKLTGILIGLTRFCFNFGFIKGTFLFIKFKFGFVKKLKLPGIVYPIELRSKTSDIQTFYQIFLYKKYDIKFEKPPQIVIDCGANIGLFSILIKNRFPNVKIVCIEPDSENFKLLKKNTSFYSDIHCENYGVWNKNTKLNISDKYDLGDWGKVVEENALNGKVNSISLNTLTEKFSINRIDVLKIDIETSEKVLFSDNYHEWLPKVKIIIIELHDWLEEGCSKPFFEAINSCFKKYRFSISQENVIIEKFE
jgi:FkbM family methyltransferase